MHELTDGELDIVLESLKWSRYKLQEYTQYPSYEYKQQRIKEVSDVETKVHGIRRARKEAAK